PSTPPAPWTSPLGGIELLLHRLKASGHPPPESPPQRPALHRGGQTARSAEVSAPPWRSSVSVPQELALTRQAEPPQFTLGTPGPTPDARSFGLPAQGAFASSLDGGADAEAPRAARSASSSARSFASSNR